MEINSNYKIYKSFDLSGEEFFTLTRLYLPLMGMDSFSLYLYLLTLENKETYSIRQILDSLNLSKINFLENAFDKLAALSLIKNYYNEQKGYYFKVIQPLNIESFFSNSVLKSFLVNQIGTVEVENIIKKSDYTVKGYTELTKRFDEVFKKSKYNYNDLYNKVFFNKIKDNLVIKNDKFDYILFKMAFDSDVIDDKVLDDEELKRNIINISYTYDLNEQEMKEVILNTISIDKDLKISDISKNAQKVYRGKNIKENYQYITKEPDVFVSSDLDDDTYKIINLLERASPKAILESLSGITPSVSELKLLEQLYNIDMPKGVINTMLMYIIGERQGSLPTSYNYFEKVANDWARKGLKTTKAALEYMKKEKETLKTKSYQYAKKEKDKPKWYDKYETELQDVKTTKKELSDEEKLLINKEAQELFK
ncbi:MAG: DnaD domain protein [Bacilli bacterium]|nr:DnaD domain protein [Bacilli bacterium]MDD2682400.1 DnaD domain protein [Bacilli bacterium]MDD3121295.1 DnaD domain protein [Bacilli bacterium]MDD4063454.1 DnaD domain protein [Bacilli bacterium]MDD4482115.1 DnaD domain protein [Bacilli bacterium]